MIVDHNDDKLSAGNSLNLVRLHLEATLGGVSLSRSIF